MTTLADHPAVAAEAAEIRAEIRAAERLALEEFVRRYAWWDRGEQFVGTPDHRVPAVLAIENTMKALWKQ